MSSSRSSSSSAQSSWAQDNRRVIGEGGVSAENSAVNVLDGGAIGSAFQFAGAAGNQALAFAQAHGDQAFGLAGQAMDQVGASQARVLDFGADALSSAVGASDRARTQAFDFGADALSAAFAFGKTANTQAQDAMSATANLVKDAYADAKGRGALTDKMIMAAIAAMALVAFMAVKK